MAKQIYACVGDWLGEHSLKRNNLYTKLNLVFGLFFFFPVLGFLFFFIKYGMLSDRWVPLFFLGILVFSFTGFTILKKLFDKISNISAQMSSNYLGDFSDDQLSTGTDELQNIVQSFSAIEQRFSNTFHALEKKASEIAILKEVSELCFVTFDPEEILHITLERALMLTNSDLGSILTLNKNEPKTFQVKATVGLGKFVKAGDRIDFETSIAKYAVINKSPLVVEDIEQDNRFGRASLAHYGTKSFVCMPIKTSKEIFGVLTISSRQDRIYSQEDVEVLTPLISNAAFTYENLRLLKENERNSTHLRSIEKIFKILVSSFRDTELLHAVLTELQSVVPFDLAFVMTLDDAKPGQLKIFDLLVSGPSNIVRGTSYRIRDSILEKVFKQESSLLVDNTRSMANPLDRELFADQGCTACLLAPLKSDGNVTGVLALAAHDAALFYSAHKLITWIANGLSLAIERNRLSAAVVKRNQELDTIRQVGSALASSTFDISKVLKYTMDMIREVMNVEAGSLLFLEGDELEIAVAFNIKIKSMKKFRLKIGQGIAGYVAARGKSILVNDIEKSPHFFPMVDESTGFKTQSALCVPMVSQGKVIGVIEVLNKINGEFDTDDKDLLQSIATSVCIALENARLYKETVSMAEQERDIRHMFQKFVPKEVLDKIIYDSENGKPVVEELKTLTLLNIDIRGFSELSRKIGSQKTVALLNSFFSVMGGVVFKHSGIVDKYLGDGFLALFGAPVSSTKDADNAIAAGFEMKKSLDAVNRYLDRKFDATVKMGISIHTGEVVVGNIGFEQKMDYTVIGDPVNTVFRLQNLTKSFPNGILISENTLRAARTRPHVGQIKTSADLAEELGDMKVYELLGQKPDKPYVVAAR
ncbi:MAG: GAF domain-containing protein [Desulfobacterales bacterium]|jgi:class 3 adenylate cyclase/putative methionine-R-sulfoxide reductase with GAF domain